VVLQNEVIIIDFKTAAAIPTVIPKEYQQQMQTYRDLIAPLYPNKTIRLGLLYSAVPKMLWV
jgi:ATP-dependent helicase/nuclease subunit A